MYFTKSIQLYSKKNTIMYAILKESHLGEKGISGRRTSNCDVRIQLYLNALNYNSKGSTEKVLI